MFAYLLISLQKEIETEKLVLDLGEYLMDVLCLSACLHHYTKRSLNIDYKNYCSIFNTGLINGAKVIYSVGHYVEDIPVSIKEYLYSLEKKIMIK